MKVVAFNGSPRKQGNTAILLDRVKAELTARGIETEAVQVGGVELGGCKACLRCFTNRDRRCMYRKDPLNDWVQKMVEADGILIGSPTYFANVSSEIKALIDRAGMVARANDDLFRRKVGAAVVAVRRAGALHAFNSINHFFFIGQMIVPGSSYWNLGVGREVGEVEGDQEGMDTMRTLGRNMAWLLERITE